MLTLGRALRPHRVTLHPRASCHTHRRFSPVVLPAAHSPVGEAMMGPGSAVHNGCTPSSASREESPMTEKTAKAVTNLGYHAHIYYDPTSTRAVAEGVCAALGTQCQVEIEAFRDTPRGPH